MRIKINFTKNTSEIPFQTQALVNSYIHKCLGRNNKFHDTKNDYSISHLCGGKINDDKKSVSFKNGGFIIVSSKNAEFLNKLLIGIITNPEFIGGMMFSGVDHIEEKFYSGWNHFFTLTPFIIKKYKDKKNYEFLSFEDADFEENVKKYLLGKLSAIDSTLDLSDFNISIKRPSRYDKIVKNVKNKAICCHISIYTNKKVAELLYNIGLGQSTGCGFGVIYKTENHKIYKIG